MAIELKGLRSVGDAADACIPQSFTISGVVGRQAAGAIAGKYETSGGGQEATPADVIAVKAMSPARLTCLVVDRSQIAARGADLHLVFSSQAHRSAWIGIGEV